MLHTSRHLRGKEVHAAHRGSKRRQKEDSKNLWGPLSLKNTTNHRNYLTAAFVLLLQQRCDMDERDGKVEWKEGKAKQWRTHDRRSGRDWNVSEKSAEVKKIKILISDWFWVKSELYVEVNLELLLWEKSLNWSCIKSQPRHLQSCPHGLKWPYYVHFQINIFIVGLY